MFVVVVDHLLDVVVDVIVVLLVVADALPVPNPVATVGNGAGDGRDSLSLAPNFQSSIGTMGMTLGPPVLVSTDAQGCGDAVLMSP